MGKNNFLSATDTSVIDQAQRVLPACYTRSVDECLNDRPQSFEHCDVLLKAYKADEKSMQKIIEDLPFCPAPSPGTDLLKVLGAGGLGLALGVLIGRHLRH